MKQKLKNNRSKIKHEIDKINTTVVLWFELMREKERKKKHEQ